MEQTNSVSKRDYLEFLHEEIENQFSILKGLFEKSREVEVDMLMDAGFSEKEIDAQFTLSSMFTTYSVADKIEKCENDSCLKVILFGNGGDMIDTLAMFISTDPEVREIFNHVNMKLLKKSLK
jgi:hypothetical protein